MHEEDADQGPIAEEGQRLKPPCQVCNGADGRYKCPACSILTCSLDCSKRHKQDRPCSGKRSRTAFIPREHFNDASINNDYNFLTAVERDIDNAARQSHSDHQAGRPAHVVRQFVQKARDIGEVQVELAPRGMKRSRTNHSHWHGKRKCLIWTIEWMIEGERVVSDRVPETQTLRETLSKLRPQESEMAHLLMHTQVNGTKSVWSVLDKRATLAQALRYRTVQEFPTIHVLKQIPKDYLLEADSVLVNTDSMATPGQLTTAQTNSSDLINLELEEGEIEDGQAVLDGPANKSALPRLDLDSLVQPI